MVIAATRVANPKIATLLIQETPMNANENANANANSNADANTTGGRKQCRLEV